MDTPRPHDRALADARDQGYTWDEIAMRLSHHPVSSASPRRLRPIQARGATCTGQLRHVGYNLHPAPGPP